MSGNAARSPRSTSEPCIWPTLCMAADSARRSRSESGSGGRDLRGDVEDAGDRLLGDDDSATEADGRDGSGADALVGARPGDAEHCRRLGDGHGVGVRDRRIGHVGTSVCSWVAVFLSSVKATCDGVRDMLSSRNPSSVQSASRSAESGVLTVLLLRMRRLDRGMTIRQFMTNVDRCVSAYVSDVVAVDCGWSGWVGSGLRFSVSWVPVGRHARGRGFPRAGLGLWRRCGRSRQALVRCEPAPCCLGAVRLRSPRQIVCRARSGPGVVWSGVGRAYTLAGFPSGHLRTCRAVRDRALCTLRRSPLRCTEWSSTRSDSRPTSTDRERPDHRRSGP